MGKEEIIFQNCLSSFKVRSFYKSIKMLSSRTKCFLAILAQAILVSRCYAGPPAMTEVKFAGGSAGSTGVWDAQWTAEKAFMTPEHKANGWHNEKDGNKRTFPEMVWYQFPVDAAFTPARVSFRPCGNSSAQTIKNAKKLAIGSSCARTDPAPLGRVI